MKAGFSFHGVAIITSTSIEHHLQYSEAPLLQYELQRLKGTLARDFGLLFFFIKSKPLVL
jgi:hypothetical protein